MTRALSGSEDLEVDLQEVALEPGDRLLLCSDGVFTVLSDDQIGDVLRREANTQKTDGPPSVDAEESDQTDEDEGDEEEPG